MAAIFTSSGDLLIEDLPSASCSDVPVTTARRLAKERDEEVNLVDDVRSWVVYPDGNIEPAGDTL